MKKNRLIYASLFLLSLIFVYFYGGKLPYTLFHIMLMLPLFSLLYTIFIYLRFKFSQDIDKKIVIKGDDVNFKFSFYNQDIFLYPYMKVKFCSSETIFRSQFQDKCFSMTPFSRKSFDVPLQCHYRGHYDIGVESVEIEDFLGILKLTYTVKEPKYITVHPRIIPLDRFFLKTDFLSESHSVLNSRNEDMSTIADVRKYTYGDSLKKIHWKLTAKTKNFMVKEFQSTSETSAILVLDLKKNLFSPDINIIIEDKVIEAAVSVIHFCLSNWIPISFVFFNKIINDIEAKNPLMFEELFSLLARVKFQEDVDVKDILEVYLANRVNKTNVIICTSNLDYELYNCIYKYNSSGFDISIIYVSPDEITGEKNEEAQNIIDSLPEIGISTYKLEISDNLKHVLERSRS